MTTINEIWTAFALCLLVIGFAGSRLSLYGDLIAGRTGLSGSWVGLVLLATATSLPELMTGLSSVTVAETPNIAVGNVLGACVFNLMYLAIVDFLHRKESVYRRARQGHILSAGFGLIGIGLVGFNVLLGPRHPWALFGVGAYTPVIFILYLIAIRAVHLYEKQQIVEFAEEASQRAEGISLRWAIFGYIWTASLVVTAGGALPFVGERLAVAVGWNDSFVGTLLVALATSMPEFAVTVGAVRIGAVDMAIANLLGSNLFNVVIIGIDDLFYRQGPLLSGVSSIHGISAMSAVIMTGLAIVGLLYRPEGRVLRTVGWVSLGLFAVYLLNSLVLFLYNE